MTKQFQELQCLQVLLRDDIGECVNSFILLIILCMLFIFLFFLLSVPYIHARAVWLLVEIVAITQSAFPSPVTIPPSPLRSAPNPVKAREILNK